MARTFSGDMAAKPRRRFVGGCGGDGAGVSWGVSWGVSVIVRAWASMAAVLLGTATIRKARAFPDRHGTSFCVHVAGAVSLVSRAAPARA
jgi:hypothetical protein